MMAASAPISTSTAAAAASVPASDQAPSSSGITRSASTVPRSAKRGIAARPISVTTRVVVSGMKVISAIDCFRARPLFAA